MCKLRSYPSFTFSTLKILCYLFAGRKRHPSSVRLSDSDDDPGTVNVTPRKQPPRPSSAPAGVITPESTGNAAPTTAAGPPATSTATVPAVAQPPAVIPPARLTMTPTTGSNIPGPSRAVQPNLGQVVPAATDPISALAVRTPVISQVRILL